MSFSRAYLFPPDSQCLARYAKAVTHPARIQILQILRKVPLLSFPDLCRRIPLCPQVISQHLQILSRANLITAMSDGPHSWYSLDFDSDNALRAAFHAFADDGGADRALSHEPKAVPGSV